MIAAISHTVGGGAPPAPLLVVGMAAVLVFPAMALMGSRPRPFRIAATTLAAQGAFHAAFLALGAPVAGGPFVAGHHHHDMVLPLAVSHADGGMWGAHVVAAAVTIAILTFGERAVLRALSWVVARSAVRVPAPRVVRFPRILATGPVLAAPRTRAAALVGPRGPPLLSF
ncbi:hypothetical protein [Microbacterium indicum]|uniref:hypothetical protein n=1 Tax=Microbacterium indicum TaxID=358100 RepID=UPI000685C141|nr:hypothetical protein [Microbacterium indicum]